MAGSAILRRLLSDNYVNVIVRETSELDLSSESQVTSFFEYERPEYVFMVAGKVGGIMANQSQPAEFIYFNLRVQINVIHAAWQAHVRKLLLLGSSCAYPKESAQPMREAYLLTGKLEPTSEAYAIAKIAGMEMCQAYRRQYGANFIAAIPADIYGPGDDFNPETAHVLPSLMARMHQAKVSGENSFVVWGSGAPRRELFHANDFADACVFLMDRYEETDVINIGAGKDISVRNMALMVRDVVGYSGEIIFDTTKPDGMPRKLLDTTRVRNMGWVPRVSLAEGIRQTYNWFLEHAASPGAKATV